jgi:hypothetical protein
MPEQVALPRRAGARSRRPRCTALLMAASATWLGCAGLCLGWGSTAPASATSGGPMADAVAASTATMQSSCNVRIALQGKAVLGAKPAPIVGTGAFDFRIGSGTITLKVATLAGPGTGTQRNLFLPTVVYVAPPDPTAAALPAGKTWIVASLTEIESTSANFPQFVLEAEGLSPLLELAQLAWGAVSASPIAARTVNGVSAAGYLVQVDLAQALAHASGPAAGALSLAIHTEITALGTTAGSAPGTVVTERLWVADGRVVLLQLSPPGAGVGVATTTLSGYGAKVAVHAPAVASVVDIASLTPGGEKESGPESDIA